MATLRAGLAVLLIVPVTLLGMPLQWLGQRLGFGWSRRLPNLYHRYLNRVLGIRRIVHGTPCADRPLLLTPNHASWLDITVLSAVLPVAFVSKAEVGGWPLIGTLARLQGTIFIDRTRRHATGAANSALAERLASGEAVALFAEGTSSDGTRVLPFRSSLLGAAIAAEADVVWVQPVAISYARLHGLPLGRGSRFRVAWYGDLDLAPHLWGVLKDGAIDVQISFGEPIRVDSAADRKRIAREAETEVRRLHAAAMRGRPLPRQVAKQAAVH
jgi:1-acyl-sn-glycerol-3-phosphate acyltransferase